MPSPGMSLEQWFTRARRGTDGSMVWDVLYDWKDAEAKLLSRMKELEGEYYKLQNVTEAVKNIGIDYLDGDPPCVVLNCYPDRTSTVWCGVKGARKDHAKARQAIRELQLALAVLDDGKKVKGG